MACPAESRPAPGATFTLLLSECEGARAQLNPPVVPSMQECCCMGGFVLGGTHGGAGKSVVAAAIACVLRDRGLDVRSFTLGAAFTGAPAPAGDGGGLCNGASHDVSDCACGGAGASDGAAAALPQGPACIDLSLTPDHGTLLACYTQAAEGGDISIVDARLSVLDSASDAAPAPAHAGCAGADAGGGGAPVAAAARGCSTAELARALGLPILLVVDVAAFRSAASIAALLRGFASADGGLEVAGLLLNRAGGAGAVEELARGLASAGVDAPVVGSLPQLGDGAAGAGSGLGAGAGAWGGAACASAIGSACSEWSGSSQPRHSFGGGGGGGGEAAANEAALAARAARQLSLDADALLAIAARARTPAPEVPLPPPARAFRVVVGVAFDQAFHRYFQQNLSLLAAAGAQLVPFSPLRDSQPPPGASALLVGGGAPEQWAARLAANRSMLAALRAFVAAGGLVAAEGEGLMYLATTLQAAPHQPRHSMAGLLPFHALALPADQRTQGYVDISVVGACPLLAPGARLRGRYARCCDVVVVEERLVRGLGAPGAAGANGGDRAAADSEASGSSGSLSAALALGSHYSHCYEARALGGAEGAAATPEGYTSGSVLGSSVHLFYGSCPAAAAQIVQRCLRVDVASTSAATAQAARVMAAAAASLCDSPSPPGALPHPRLAAPPRSSSSSHCSDAAQSSPRGGCATPPLGWRRVGAQSTPDLVHYAQDGAAVAVGGGGDNGDVFGYWGSGPQDPPPRATPRPRPLSTRGEGPAGGGWPQQQLGGAPHLPSSLGGGGEPPRRELKSLKTMSIPANMHRLGFEPQQQQQRRQQQQQHGAHHGGLTVGSLDSASGGVPFAVPKRWSLELQRLSSHITQHMLPGSGGGGSAGSGERSGSSASRA